MFGASMHSVHCMHLVRKIVIIYMNENIFHYSIIFSYPIQSTIHFRTSSAFWNNMPVKLRCIGENKWKSGDSTRDGSAVYGDFVSIARFAIAGYFYNTESINLISCRR